MDQLLSVLVVSVAALAAFFGISFLKKPKTSKTTRIARDAVERLDEGMTDVEKERAETEAALEEALAEVREERETVLEEHDDNELVIDNVTDFDGFTFRN